MSSCKYLKRGLLIGAPLLCLAHSLLQYMVPLSVPSLACLSCNVKNLKLFHNRQPRLSVLARYPALCLLQSFHVSAWQYSRRIIKAPLSPPLAVPYLPALFFRSDNTKNTFPPPQKKNHAVTSGLASLLGLMHEYTVSPRETLCSFATCCLDYWIAKGIF